MIFLDTSYLISLISNEHCNHQRAKEIYQEIENKEKIISKLVITEVITVLDKKLKVSKEVLKHTYSYLNEDFNVIDDYIFFDMTMKRVLKEKNLGFFDCMYITIIENLEIEEITSFDKDFDNIEKIQRIY